MSVSILETLQNAEFNLKSGLGFQQTIGWAQLHNAVALLEKGYGLNEQFDEIIADHASVEDVPDKPDTAQQAQRDTAARAGMAEEDKAMLDWLTDADHTLTNDGGAGDGPTTYFAEWREGNLNDYVSKRTTGSTVREAIRAAMNAALPKGRL